MPSVNEQLKGRAYWRSLDERADSPAFRELASKEFADYAPQEVVSSPTRRAVVKLMGASMALAGVTSLGGCRRWPERKLAPYNERPEGRIPGVPENYATVMELGGVAQPLLVSSYDGRPIKIEGNPGHPYSQGKATAFAQASILEMYDPERSRYVLRRDEEGKQVKSSWAEVEKVLREINLNDGFAVLGESTSSPTVADLRRRLKEKHPQSRWFEYEPVSGDNETAGLRLAFGKPLRSVLRLDEATVIVSLESDFLGDHPASIKYTRDWAKGRKSVDGEKPVMNRLYVVESRFSTTGANADRRLAVKSSAIAGVVKAIAAGVGVGADAGEPSKFIKEVVAVVADLKAHVGRCVVTAGRSQPAEVHAAVALINDALGNTGKTVSYIAVEDRPTHVEAIRTLASEMSAGTVKTLLILGGNPAYDAPADLGFADLLKANKAKVIHLSSYVNETSKLAGFHLPRSHYLEAWGDARTWDGTASVVQPLIMPLFDTRSMVEVLAMVLDDVREGYPLVRRAFEPMLGADTFERGWRKTLHDGLLAGSEAKGVDVKPAAGVAEKIAAMKSPEGEFELTFFADYKLYDGRFATNGWLQEFPDPITKLVWDNAALVSPADAKTLGITSGDKIQVMVGGKPVELPVYVLPGQAVGSIAVGLGYGRSAAGYVGSDIGHNAYAARRSDGMFAVGIEKPTRLSRGYDLVTTQDHHAIDAIGMNERQERVDRFLVRSAPLEFFEEHPDFAKHMGLHTPGLDPASPGSVPLQIFEEPADFSKVHRWGMAIDLSTCTGCGACVIACQAENNVPIVGKAEVKRNREMHWLRVDRYFAVRKGSERVENPGDVDAADPSLEYEAVYQPMPCQHCETAPCEQVCPVAATVHDHEGINVMVYNRCVGTRYCSNNCPYKVRRFNYFDWHYKPVHGGHASATYLGIPDQQQNAGVDPVKRMGFNPEVSVRMRGVMEKCTFCTQRIKAKTIPALNAFRAGERQTPFVEDGEITPACAQTCPTDAIVFGNLNDKSSRVAQLAAKSRAYEVLDDLNTRPRVKYLARVTNPGHGHGAPPELTAHVAAAGHGEKHEEGHEGDKHEDGHEH